MSELDMHKTQEHTQTGEEILVKEALVRNGLEFLFEHDLATEDQIINDLILQGFLVHPAVQDVDIYVNTPNKQYTIYLSFKWWRYPFINIQTLNTKLNLFLKSGLKKWSIIVKKQILTKNTQTYVTLGENE